MSGFEEGGSPGTPRSVKHRELREAFRESMRCAGVHDSYLRDEHWERGWGKHFEHCDKDDVTPCFGVLGTLRVMQWNLLAEGLTPDGFLMPLISAEHVEGFETRLAALVRDEGASGVARAAALYARGHRNVLWDGEGEDYASFVSVAAETMTRMKACANKDDKVAVGRELKARYSPPESSSCGSGQMSLNERIVAGVEHRLLRVLWFVSLLQPDVLCVQELDNFEFLKDHLEDLGYCCSRDGDGEAYVPLKHRQGADYAAKLNSSRFAFAPKTDAKAKRMGKSNSRFFLEQRTKDELCGRAYETDDDGTAIFWKRSRLKLAEGPDFRVLPGEQDFLDYASGAQETLGSLHGDAGAVRVRLDLVGGFGQSFVVHATHLSSGKNKEVRRIAELRSLWTRTGFPRGRKRVRHLLANFKGSYFGRFPVVSAAFSTSDHLLRSLARAALSVRAGPACAAAAAMSASESSVRTISRRLSAGVQPSQSSANGGRSVPVATALGYEIRICAYRCSKVSSTWRWSCRRRQGKQTSAA